MKKIMTLVFALTALSSFAGTIITGDTAKTIYTKTLAQAKAENAGDGVLVKSGTLRCTETGAQEPFKYKCNGISEKDSRSFFLYLFKDIKAENSGDNVMEKSAEVTCTETGAKQPFKYQCEV